MGPAKVASGERWDAFISYRRKMPAVSRTGFATVYSGTSCRQMSCSPYRPKRELHKRRPRIYIDQAYEKPSENFLQRKLYPALDNSDRLIVVSSPSCFDTILDDNGAEQPNWLVVEIDRFSREIRTRGDRVPSTSFSGLAHPTQGFRPAHRADPSDPADLRQFTWWRRWRLGSRFDAGLTKLVAGLYDVREVAASRAVSRGSHSSQPALDTNCLRRRRGRHRYDGISRCGLGAAPACNRRAK